MKSTCFSVVYHHSSRSIKRWNSLKTVAPDEGDYYKMESALDDYVLLGLHDLCHMSLK